MTGPARARVIIDNDFSGDPDDLYQLAHHVLSPSVEIPFVIGSHLAPGDPFDPSDQQAQNGAEVARGLLSLLGAEIPVIAGSDAGLVEPNTPVASAATETIISEALREDTDTPLYFALGGGLTELATALLKAPEIADRLTAVWIGGPEHQAAPPPGAGPSEYNLRIDIPAAQQVFSSNVPLWQVPRDVYRQCLISAAEIDVRVRPHGVLGRRLAEAIDAIRFRLESAGMPPGETYCMGDSPLVLLTALQSTFEPTPSSCQWTYRPAPTITDSGEYGPPAEHARQIRVYTRLDTRLMTEDLYAKLAQAAGGSLS